MDAKKIASLFDNPRFTQWFGGSKIADEAGLPAIVYHRTNSEPFDVFDKGLSGKNYTPHYGEGFYFSGGPYDGMEYGSNVMPVFLQMKNPAKYSLSMVEAAKKSGMEVSEYAKSLGHDGFIVGDKFKPQYVAFEPTQIKSVDNDGTFDPTNPNIYKSALPYAVAGGGLMAAMSPTHAQAVERIRQNDAPLEDAWNPVEAFGGGLGGGLRSALAGVLPDGAMDWALGGLMSGGR